MGVTTAFFMIALATSTTYFTFVEGLCRIENSSSYSLHNMFADKPLTERAADREEPQHVCYNDSVSVCRCTARVLDCSGNRGTLRFIPKVNGTFSVLNFSDNNLTVLDEDFFLNATWIEELVLGHNKGLSRIYPHAFRPLQRLRNLSLNYDYKLLSNYSYLDPVLSLSQLTTLDLNGGDLGPLPVGLFDRHRMPKLRNLYINSNKLRHLNMSMLAPLQSLTVFGASDNSLSYIHADYVPQLETLKLPHNSLHFPRTCRYWKSLYPSLKMFQLRNNKVRILTEDVCLPSLEILDLSGNPIEKITKGMFNHKFFPRLKQLYLQGGYGNSLWYIYPQAFDNPQLETLSLLYNSLSFNTDYVSSDSFKGCSGLKHLLVGYNKISNKEFSRVFGHLRNLRYIHLGSCFMTEVTRDMFSDFPKLDTLCLYNNKLMDLPDGVFDSLLSLNNLQLDKNEIQTIRSTTFGSELRKRLRRVDLSQNPFHCDCDILWFQSWLKSSPSLFNNTWADYQCNSPSGSLQVASFSMNRQVCLLSRSTSIFIVIVVSLVMLVSCAGTVFFRFRWHIRLILHENFRGRGDGWLRRQHAENFDYDVFVCYAKEDLAWIRTRLMPELENRWGLRLCVHERDFIPGFYIVDNIAQSINSSRKLLTVFSTNFARSSWCQFELSLCLHHAIEHDDALVVVCLGDIDSRDLTPTMMAVFKTTTYIRWQNHSDAVVSFWGRLSIALSELMAVPAVEPAYETEQVPQA